MNGKEYSYLTAFVSLALIGILVYPTYSVGIMENSPTNNKIVFASDNNYLISIPGPGFSPIKLPAIYVPKTQQPQLHLFNTSFPNMRPVNTPIFLSNNSSLKATASYQVNKAIFAYQNDFGRIIPSSFFPDQPKTNWMLLVIFDGDISESTANEIILSHHIPAGANIGEALTGERYYLLISRKDYNSITNKIKTEKNATIDPAYQRTIGDKILVLIDFNMDYPGSGAAQRLISEGVPLKRTTEITLFYNPDTPDTVASEIQSQLRSDNRVLCTKIWYGWWACGVNGCGTSSLGNRGYY